MQRHPVQRCAVVKLALILAVFSLTANSSLAGAAQEKKSLRISTWYWLNSAPREEWDADFQAVAKAGFTDLLLCWGLDAAAPILQEKNTRFALDLCSKHGLGAYLFIWHPTHNSLPRKPEFQQVDNLGNRLFSFNLFHEDWRATQWKEYLQKVASTYKHHPAFAGYLFDDSFALGQIGSLSGDKTRKRGDFVSYSPSDFSRFRAWLQKKYGSIPGMNKLWRTNYRDWAEVEPPRKISQDNEPAWNDWCAARLEWLKQWSRETARYIREIDPSPSHEIYLEDTYHVLGLDPRSSEYSFRPITVRDSLGLDFGAVAPHFDAVCGYTFFNWYDSHALPNALEATKRTLRATQSMVGPAKKIIYTFWVSDFNINKPLPVQHPNAKEIVSVAKAALDLGVRHVDYYGFRIGDWRVNDEQWVNLRPGSKDRYPVLQKIKGFFLCDRPDVLRDLAEEHKRLSGKSR